MTFFFNRGSSRSYSLINLQRPNFHRWWQEKQAKTSEQRFSPFGEELFLLNSSRCVIQVMRYDNLVFASLSKVYTWLWGYCSLGCKRTSFMCSDDQPTAACLASLVNTLFTPGNNKCCLICQCCDLNLQKVTFSILVPGYHSTCTCAGIVWRKISQVPSV